MKTRFLRGSTQENNSLTLANGELSIDLEKRAVRLHDGVTPGGFEIPGVKAYEPPGSGDDFLGEVTQADFISFTDLAANIGLSAGTAINGTAPWLKFNLDTKTIYYPKMAARYSLSWLDINNVGAVDGSLTININGFSYKVRLMKTSTTNPIDFTSGVYKDPVESHGSEWNRLMYRVCEVNPTSQVGDNWALYTVDELGLNTGDYGYRAHMQETLKSDPTRTFNRGYHNGNIIDGFSDYPNTTASNMYGWRPVLELIE